MTSKSCRILAILMTALMVFECVPAVAYAEAGEAVGRAVDATVGELLEGQNQSLRDAQAAIGAGALRSGSEHTTEAISAHSDSAQVAKTLSAEPAVANEMALSEAWADVPEAFDLWYSMSGPDGEFYQHNVYQWNDGQWYSDNLGNYWWWRAGWAGWTPDNDASAWRVEIKRGSANYDDFKATDNGADVRGQFKPKAGDPDTLEYTLRPQGKLHVINVVFEQEGCTPGDTYIVIWPTYDFKTAYGLLDEDVTTDAWASGGGLMQAVVTGDTPESGYEEWMYYDDVDPSLARPENGIVMQSTPLACQGTRNDFTFHHTGIFSFDYAVEADEGDDYAFKLYEIGTGSDKPLSVANEGTVAWRHAEIPIEVADGGQRTFRMEVEKLPEGSDARVAITNMKFDTTKRSVSAGIDGEGDGTGTVILNGQRATSHNASYNAGTRVTLEAQKDQGSFFQGWYTADGELLSKDAKYSFTLRDDSTVNARFAKATDDNMQGLVTHLPDGWSVEYKTGAATSSYQKAHWGLAEDLQYRGNAVWRTLGVKGSATVSSGLMIEPKNDKGKAPDSCYVVYDYVCVGSGSNSSLIHRVTSDLLGEADYLTSTSPTDTYIPSEKEVSYGNDIDSVLDDTWKTGVAKLHNVFPSRPVLYLQHLLYSDETAELYGAFISNVRIYESADDFEDPSLYKSLEMHYTPAHGSVTVTISYDSNRHKDVREFNDTSSAHAVARIERIPRDCFIQVDFNRKDDLVHFDGWYDTCGACNDGDYGGRLASGTFYQERYYTEGSDPVVLAASSTRASDIVLSRKADADSDWVTVDETAGRTGYQGSDWYRWETWTLGDDPEQVWKIAIDEGGTPYESIVATDNGRPVDVSGDEAAGRYVEVKPNDETHHVKLTLRRADGSEQVEQIILWPTLDWDDAFGTHPGPDGKMRLDETEGYKNSFWDEEAVYYTQKRVPEILLSGMGGVCAWLYDGDPDKAFADGEHEKVFTSAFANDATHTYASFTFYGTGYLSFDYAVWLADEDAGGNYRLSIKKNGSSVATGIGNGTDPVPWTHMEIPITPDAPGKPVGVVLEFMNYGKENPSQAAISNVRFNSESVKADVGTKAIDGGSGAITVDDGTDASAGPANSYYLGSQLTFKASPDPGSVFVGWYDSKGALLGTDAEYTLVVSGTVDVHAHFLGTASGKAAYVDGRTYATLGGALAAAKPGGTVLLLKDNYQLEGNLEVPAGVTLVIPCGSTDLGYKANSGYPPRGTASGSSNKLGPNASVFKTLVIPSGRTLTVRGNVIVNAVVGRPQQGHWDQDVNGGCGKVVNQGTIAVESGGVLESPGYIEGPGSIVAKSGSTVSDLFVVRNWRGGSQAYDIYQSVYPMNEYDSHNIQCPLTINSGATYTGIVRMFAEGAYHETRFPQVDDQNGLIRLASGASLTKTYDGSSRETYSITGGATFADSRLAVIEGVILSTGENLYPWNGIYGFVLNDGSYTFSKSFKFMPGCRIEAKGANITVSPNAKVVLYDRFDDATNTDKTEYPKDRGAAKLILDAKSSLTNNGSFAGTIETETSAITGGPSASWSVLSREANGYRKGTKELTFAMASGATGDLGISRGGGYTWQFSGDGHKIVWSGADYEGLNDAIRRAKEALKDQSPYTEESVAALRNVLGEAESLVAQDLGIDSQEAIDEAANRIDELIPALAKRTFTVTFDPAPGSMGDSERSVTKEYGEDLTADEMPEPTRDGYTFEYWYEGDSPSGATKVDELKGITESHTLTAKWTPTPYTIEYRNADGTDLETNDGHGWTTGDEGHPTTYTIEQEVTLGTPRRTGYEFGGWTIVGASDGGGVPNGAKIPKGTMGNLTATASWTPQTYKVTFDAQGGKLYDGPGDDANELPGGYSVTVTYDSTYQRATAGADGPIVGLPTAKLEGYELASWKLGGQDITPTTDVKVIGDVVLTASWQVGDAYAITYDMNDAGGPEATWPTGRDADHPGKYDVSTPEFTVPDPVREGYDFRGWKREGTPGTWDEADPATVRQGTTGIIKFTAQWEVKHHEFTLDASGGSFGGGRRTESVTLDHFAEVGKLPEPSRNGYALTGWLDGSDKVWTPEELASHKVDGPMELIAQWGPVTYTITFNLNGGQWKPEDKGWGETKKYTIEDPDLLIPTPACEGYTFGGWQASDGFAAGPGTDLVGGLVKTGSWGNVTLTATWTVNSHTLRWVFGDGVTPDDANERDYGTEIAEDVPEDPQRPGYRFDGWREEGSGAVLQRADLLARTMPDGDLTFTAQWTSRLEELNGLGRITEGTREQAHALFQMLTPEQRGEYDATSLIRAIVAAKLGDVNRTLNVGGVQIATLSFAEGDPSTILVYMDEPTTPAAKMLSIGFLNDLFGCDEVASLDINGAPTDKDQTFGIMFEVAYAALAEQEGYLNNRGGFRSWLLEHQSTLTIGALAGTTVPATLVDASGRGPSYDVAFYDEHHDVGKANVVEIHFELGDGGRGVNDVRAKAGTPLADPGKPERTGYAFKGWYRDAACTDGPFAFDGRTTMPEEDLTLYAKWEAHRYTVGFDAGATDASGSMEGQEHDYDEPFPLPGCGFTREGYSFAGWRLPNGMVSPEGTEASKLTAEQGGSVTLTATWTADTHDVTFDFAQGAVPEGFENPVRVTYDSTYGEAFAGGELPEPTREGYDFAGWWDESRTPAIQVLAETKVKVTAPQTLTARWTERGDVRYTVNYYLQNLEDDAYPAEPERSVVLTNGTTGSTVYAEQTPFEGFTLDLGAGNLSGEVKADGSLVLDLYYTRDSYAVTFRVGEAAIESNPRYGADTVYPDDLAWEAVSGDYAILSWELEGSAGEDGEPLTYGPDALPKVTGPATYVAELDKRFEAETPDGSATWRTLGVAMEEAPRGTAAEPTIVSLHQDAAVPEEGLTVPSGIMLLVPYMQGDAGYDTKDNNNQHIPGPPVAKGDVKGKTGADGTEFRRLTVPDGRTLAVEGRVLVNALVGRDANGHFDQDVTGGYGRVELGDGSKVVVRSGGTFDCHGYVDGSGTVTCESGGTVGDLFVVRNWRGGSQAAAVFGKVYPYNEYDCHNIAVSLAIQAGGSLEGLVTMHAEGAYYSTRFPLVDPGNGLIRQTRGSTTRTFDGERETWSVTGGAEFSKSTLYIISMDLSTGSFTYPIDGDMDLVLSDGDYRFSEDYKFLTGSTITCRDADVTVGGGATLVLYQRFDDPDNTDGTAYPKRDAAWMSLDARSSLTNHGTFAGKVRAAAPSVRHGEMGARWEATTEEANGYYGTKPFGRETIQLTNGLDVDCPGHTYEVSIKGEVLWDGAESEFHPVEEMADIIGSGVAGGGAAGGSGGDEAPAPVEGLDMETTLGDDGSITVEVSLDEERGEGSAIGSAEDAVGALLRALAARADVFYSASTMTGKDDYTVILSEGVSGYDVRMFTERLGLVAAAEENARARADADEQGEGKAEALSTGTEALADADPIGADLNGVTGRIRVKGTEDYPVETTVTMVFHADEPEPEPEPEERPLVAVYRLYNPYDGQHLLTTDGNEYDELERVGWRQEGVASWQPEVEVEVAALADGAGAMASQTLVYRLYNPSNGDHLYTTMENEVADLGPRGWRFEGVAFASAEGSDEGAVPVYRLWNPYMTDRAGLGSHLYTASANEYSELGRIGWNQEDVYWYASPAPGDPAA